MSVWSGCNQRPESRNCLAGKMYTANEMLLLALLWCWGLVWALSSVFFHESQFGINCQSERWLCVVLLLQISIMNKNGYAPLADWSLFLFKSLKWVAGRFIYGVNLFFCHMVSFFFIRLLLHLVIKRVFGCEHIKTLSATVGFITVL